MVKAHLALLIIGLGTNQAFTSDDERDRHWAEGVYFPPVIAPSTLQNLAPSLDTRRTAQQTRRKPDAKYYGSINQSYDSQSLGYPGGGYDPYRTSEIDAEAFFSGYRSEYVPRNYSPDAVNEYNEHESGYRVNDFNNRENYYNDGYRSYELNGYAHGRYRDRRERIHNKYDYDPVNSNPHSGRYGHRSDLLGYLETMPRDHSQNLDMPSYYGRFSGDIQYYPDWYTTQLVDEFRMLPSPWETLCPLSNSGVPYYSPW